MIELKNLSDSKQPAKTNSKIILWLFVLIIFSRFIHIFSELECSLCSLLGMGWDVAH